MIADRPLTYRQKCFVAFESLAAAAVIYVALYLLTNHLLAIAGGTP